MTDIRKPGQRTGEFGSWLTKELKDYPQYQVYYDHGDPKVDDNVAGIKAFLGEEVTRENKLADIDLMVANQQNEVLLLIEIEESPISPKTLLGDIFACVFSSGFAARIKGEQTYFQVTPRTQLWVAGYLKREVVETDDLINGIQEQINQFILCNQEKLIDQVKLIIESDLETCLEKLQRSTMNLLVD